MKRLSDVDVMQCFREVRDDATLTTAVQTILSDVQSRGQAAVLEYTERFDGVKPASLRVKESDLAQALSSLTSNERKALQTAADNIRRFAQLQRDSVQEFETECDGITLGQVIVPLQRVGVYVPGGRYPLLSSALMTMIPAQVAGVQDIIVCSPPSSQNPDGLPSNGILAACALLGVTTVYTIGGAQAIAAMAYGLKDLSPVDKIVGPGNQYVSKAKELVSRTAAIDFFAGPSEVLIIADDSADPQVVAADLLSQAEHDVQARAFLLSDSKTLIEQVSACLSEQLRDYPETSPIHEAATTIGAVLCDTLQAAVKLSNTIAPEHLELQTSDNDALFAMLTHYGSLFLGPYTPVALGDYASGTNHTLPTQGGARTAGGLSVFHFLKMQTWQRASRDGLQAIAETVCTLADLEGLPAHRASVDKRLQ